MKVQNLAGPKHFKRLLSRIFGKQFWILFSLFIAYNLVMGGLGYTLLYDKLPDRLKQKVMDRLVIKNAPLNFIRGLIAHPEKLKIDIKHKHFQRMAYVRNSSMNHGSLVDVPENKARATIWHNGEPHLVELNLKGRLRDHWEHEEMWSYKVKVKGDDTVLGMSNFAIQRPRTRYYINEWLLHEIFRYSGIMSLRYKFVSININGKGSRIYAIEEGFENELIEYNNSVYGPLLKFDRDFYWSGGDAGGTNKTGLALDLWGATVIPKSKKQMREDPSLIAVFEKGQSLLESFRQNKLSTSEVFDTKILANYFALIEIFGGEHLSTLDNVRFYYNPITSKIEPITHDLGAFFRITDRERFPSKLNNSPLIGTERSLGLQSKPREHSNWKLIPWFDAAFKDPVFYKEYVSALEKVTSKAFLDGFFEEFGDEFLKKPINNASRLPAFQAQSGPYSL